MIKDNSVQHEKRGFYIGLFAVLLSVLPMLLIFTLTSKNAGDKLLDIISNGAKSKTLFLSLSISDVYKQHEVTIKNLSQSDVYETLQIKPISQYLSEVKNDNPHFNSIKISDLTGRIVAHSSKIDETNKKANSLYPLQKGNIALAATAKQGDVFIYNLLNQGGNIKGITYVTPITDDKNINVIYLLIVETNFVAINGIIKKANQIGSLGGKNNVYVTTKSGRIIASTDPELSPFTVHPAAKENNSFSTKIASQNDSGTFIYRLQKDDEIMVAHADMHQYTQGHPLDWTIIASSSLKELSKPASDVRKQIAVASIIVGLFVFIVMSLIGKRFSKIIWSKSNYDRLTKLPNRQLLFDRLSQSIQMTTRANTQSALLFIDLDQFKDINDTLGHTVGDELLVAAANLISSSVRDMDTVSRIGGDEFAVIINGLPNLSRLHSIAQDILDAFKNPIKVRHNVLYISASIGITVYPQDGNTVVQLLKNADQAMYLSKKEGRRRFSFFTQEMQNNAQRRLYLANRLREAIKENQFELYYQPIISLEDGVIRKAEALIRWNSPEEGIITPASFIPIAEETNLIIEIGDWVFKQATQQLAEWRNMYGLDIQISINASPAQLKTQNLYEKWAAYLENYNVPAKGIIVEITESMLTESDPITAEQFLKFRDAGLQIAIDDFGTGYSSLSYLNKFDIDYLKIDKSFINGISESADDLHLTEAIIAVAHKLGLEVIAEGVETEQQHQLLKGMKCDYCQGYLFSKPLDVRNFNKYIALINVASNKQIKSITSDPFES